MDKHTKLQRQLLEKFAGAPSSVVVARNDGVRVQFPVDNRLFLAERFARILKADMDWFETIISHQPSVGVFYETVLRNALKELAPAGCEIATGFVLDPYRPNRSKQIDIIAYDHANSSPVFKNGEFVVVRPSSVISLTEVKKTLRARDIEQTIDGTFFSNLGSKPLGTAAFDGVQHLNIFGFSSELEPIALAEKLRDYLDKKISYARVQHRKTKKIGTMILSEVVLPSSHRTLQRFRKV